ncbi:MAG: NADH-quinone oxidoreductase subunit NuoG, partial [Gammaproteobacteria bacterium]|nr:NADH-quinone oxidoreductase subunit NuoG [Gammaproteobacteria bacterium]
QKATMEFLLINHPLDCPICDQGGECELQDLAMGFGRDVSRYAERKRVFKDENLGPLVSTDMTRCIHCTRCVRFGQEIAGNPALGTIGRGEMTQISTFIEQSIEHELSANIIDLCPVGALNNKPYRYRARAWEMTQVPLVSPHDCVGTNLNAHVLRGRVMRVVPRANEDVNETWIADRDRFSYEGFYAADRALKPMVKQGGEWVTVDWEVALETAAKGLQQVVGEFGAAQVGVLASPISSLEELALTAKVARGLGTANIDHRLRRVDFRDQANDPVAPLLGCTIAQLEQASAVLVVGSNLRKEVPLLAHRVRTGAVRHGSKVSFINPRAYDVRFPVTANLTSNGLGMAQHLAAVLAASMRAQGKTAPAHVTGALDGVAPTMQHEAVAASLAAGDRRVILLGALAQHHASYSEIRALAATLAAVTGATLGYLPEGGNAVGAALAGVLPHRTAGRRAVARPGLNVVEMLSARLKAYVLVGGIESADLAPSSTTEAALRGADCVVAITPYASEEILATASVILPSGVFAETSGTWVNVEGRWQSVAGVAKPAGDARPAWKILRVLGNLLGLAGFEYASSEEVRDELRHQLETDKSVASPAPTFTMGRLASVDVTRETPIYRVDAIVRRSGPLQATADGIAGATGGTA